MTRALILLAVASLTSTTFAQSGNPLDTAVINRIRGEAVVNSQAMETHWWLSEVFGPRATGTPGYQKGADWVMGKFKEWGLQNIHIERFPFGQGWTIERFSAHIITEHSSAPMIGQPRWYSPSTNGTITSDVVYVKATTEAELEKYKGQLRGKIVVLQAPRAVRMLEGRIILRMTDDDWKEAMTLPTPPAKPAATPGGPSPAQQFAQAVQGFLVAEGAGAVLDRGSDNDMSAGGSDLSWQTQRVDGGTIFPGSGGSRDPKVPQQVPSATLAVEHYNRIVRLLERNQPVRVELNIQTKFYPETDPAGSAFNIIAEIPGTDLAHEVVLLGAHFDTYPYATGATDNTTGSTAMIEAVRVIQALKLRPRRTIRIALWAAEEQGLLGSREYVNRHYFDAQTKTPKPEHKNLQAYFNLDNGTGRIVGIWGQGNTGAMKMFDQWGQALKDIGWKNVSPRTVTATDHTSFENAGLPGFQFIQERLEYNSRTHHSNMDTFDHVQKDDVIQQGAAAAVFAWYAANTPDRLPRKTN